MRTPDAHTTAASAAADRRIDACLRELDTVLDGPRRARADLLAEARDGLADATDAYVAAGLTPDDAARRAVAEFGAVADVAPAYQEELTAAQGRRTALAVLVIHLIVFVEGELSWRIFDLWQGRRPGPGYLALAHTVDVVGVVFIVALALLLLAYGRMFRYVPRRALVRATGGLAFAVFAFLLAAGATLTLTTPAASASVVTGAAFLAAILVPGGVTSLIIGRGARRCLTLAA